MTLQTVASQAPLSMEFSREEYWSGLPFFSPEDLPDPEIESGSPALQADSLPSAPPGKEKGILTHCLSFHHPLPLALNFSFTRYNSATSLAFE